MNIIIFILAVMVSAELWRRGGSGKPELRKLGVPILLGLAKLLFSFNWLSILYIPFLWAMIQVFSYGISSPVHKFWVWVFGGGSDGNNIKVELCTRATCGFFWALPSTVFAFITGDWLLCSLYVIFLTVANGLIGAYVKNVEISERAVGASVALSLLV